MFHIFIAKPATVFAHGQSHAVATGLVVCAGVLGEEGLNRITAFDADGHLVV